MPELKLYNTLTRTKERFVPNDPACITMYVCGPTVYNFAHIGNARPVVVFDCLFRLLDSLYPKVIYARNITDIDDKIIQAAAERNSSIDVITREFTHKYREDMGALNALTPTIEPLATEHLEEMIALIERLLTKNSAYVSDDHVLFSVQSMQGYGALSGRKLEDMLAGARVEVADYKRHPGDFVLWKPSTDSEPGWKSPWGRGRPGWHLECSAMIHAHLGDAIDIHGGGRDLIFPHHENERAQSCCGYGGNFVKYWLHNAYVDMEGEKMSKSLGNVRTVRDLLKRHSGEVIRFSIAPRLIFRLVVSTLPARSWILFTPPCESIRIASTTLFWLRTPVFLKPCWMTLILPKPLQICTWQRAGLTRQRIPVRHQQPKPSCWPEGGCWEYSSRTLRLGSLRR